MKEDIEFTCALGRADNMYVVRVQQLSGDKGMKFEVNDESVYLSQSDIKKLRKFLRGEPSSRRKAEKEVLRAVRNYLSSHVKYSDFAEFMSTIRRLEDALNEKP